MSSFRVRIDERVSAIVETLSGPRSVFPTMAETLVFGALVGFRFSRREALGEVRRDPISSSVFESGNLQGYLYLLAVAVESDIAILRDDADDSYVRIFEEYALGGFLHIEDYMSAHGKSAEEAILSLMSDEAAAMRKQEEETRPKPKIVFKKR